MHIDKPCPDGSAIQSLDGSLHCTLCDSRVIDLREVTRRRAEALVAAARGESKRVCVRMFTDRHGRPSFLLEPVRPRVRLPIVEVALVATLASACGSTSPALVETHTTVPPDDAPRGERCAQSPEETSRSTSGSEASTPSDATDPRTEPAPTPGTPVHRPSGAPRDFPAEEMVDGGLG